MAYYRKKKLSDGKWHAIAVTMGRPATTREVAERLARRSSVSVGDVYSVLLELGDVIGEFMSVGQSVKLEGVGTFMLGCRTKGKGVDSPEQLTSRLIKEVRVNFIPEYVRGSKQQVTRRAMISNHLDWTEVE